MQPLGRTLSFPVVLYEYCLLVFGNFVGAGGSREVLHIKESVCPQSWKRIDVSSLLTLNNDNLNKRFNGF